MDSAANHMSSFVKFITLEDSKQTLRLPKAWTLYKGHRLPMSVFLRNRHGDLWVVKVDYNDITKRYSFADGWEIFFECNKVEFGDCILFKFNGTSTFDFKLFGQNNEEKEYVRLANFKREAEELQEDIQLQPAEEPEGLGQDRQLSCDDFNDELADAEPKPKKRKGETRAPAITQAHEDAILRKAGIPRPKVPYFVTKRRLNRGNAMYVPRDVIKDFMIEFPEEVMLRDEKGREWKAPVQNWQDGRVWLSKAWGSYCRSNHVGFDDWCIIEFVKPEAPGAQIYLKARLVPAASIQRS